MSESKLCVRAFNLTVSVRENISDACIKALKTFIKKVCLWYYIVLERGESGKLHMHACLFFKDSRDKKKLRENIWDRFVKPYHSTSIGRIAVHIQAMPGTKWIDEYLLKEEGVEVLEQVLPPAKADLEEFIPTQEVQDMLIKAAEKEQKSTDPFYAMHEVAYKQWLHENTWVSSSQTAHEYFQWRMFVKKDQRVVADSRRVHQMAVALHKYSTDSYKLTNLEICCHVKENCITDYA